MYDLENLFSGTLDLSGWSKEKVRDNYVYTDVPIPGLRQEVYIKEQDGVIFSVGVFSYRNTLCYIAWGLKKDEHCSFHAPVSPDGKLIETRVGCPDVVPLKDEYGSVVCFTLDGKESYSQNIGTL